MLIYYIKEVSDRPFFTPRYALQTWCIAVLHTFRSLPLNSDSLSFRLVSFHLRFIFFFPFPRSTYNDINDVHVSKKILERISEIKKTSIFPPSIHEDISRSESERFARHSDDIFREMKGKEREGDEAVYVVRR